MLGLTGHLSPLEARIWRHPPQDSMPHCSAFVLMPFQSEFDSIYEGLIKPSLEEAGFNVKRADDIDNSREILIDIVVSILDADLVVADLTGANPNVYYELGIAHAVGAKVIILTQEIGSLPFDLHGYRAIPYSTHFAEVKEARDHLTNRAAGAISGKSMFGTPLIPAATNHHALKKEIEQRLNRIRPCSDQQIILPRTLEDDEEGYLDILADAEQALPAMTSLFQRVTPIIAELGERATHYGNMLKKETPSGARRLVNAYAQFIRHKTDEIETVNEEFEPLVERMADWIDLLVSQTLDSNTDIDLSELTEARDQFHSASEIGADTADKIHGFADATLSMVGIERSLNREAKRLHREISRQEGFVIQSSALFARLADALGERLGGL